MNKLLSINDISNEAPYKKFKHLFNLALENKQENIDAIVVSSFNPLNSEVNSRYVNLKYILKDEWIFFTNYKSKKAYEFKYHNQISVLIYWNTLGIQIRMKAKIKKTDNLFSDNHFKERSLFKNAVAQSSYQSQTIKSYELVKKNYEKKLLEKNLLIRPDYWGGYSFIPYYFEFWEGKDNRLNKRESFKLKKDIWIESILQP